MSERNEKNGRQTNPIVPHRTVEFAEFSFDAAKKLLWSDGKTVPLAPKACEILGVLIEHAPQLVSKEELMNEVWSDSFVEEANLTHHISALRKALGEDRNGRKFIETIPRKGYRFVAPIRQVSDASIEISMRERSVAKVVEEMEVESALKENQAAITQTARSEPMAARSIPQSTAARISRRSSRILVGLTIVLLVGGAIFGAYWFFVRKSPMVFQPGNIRRLTTSGRATAPKISPDGRYILYLQRDGGERSVWIRQIATDSDIRIAPPVSTEDVYGGLTFSPDGEYVYYRLKRKGEKFNTLYRVPSLGGAAKKILENIDGTVSFAPDGKRFAFLRPEEDNKVNLILLIADANGANERVLARRQQPNSFNGAVAWSPDGAIILCPVFSNENGFHYEFAAVNAESGEIQVIRSQNWQAADSLVWLPDGNSFLLIGQDDKSAVNQVWQVAYPAGEIRQITKGIDSYSGLAVTADGRFLTTVKLDLEANLWLTDLNAETEARQITDGNKNYDGINGLSWMPDGKIIYQTRAGGTNEIWTIGGSGGDSQKIADGVHPTISPDGRYAVFQNGGDSGLWRVNLSDGTLLRLTEQVDFMPQFTPDGRWIYFCRFGEQSNVYRVSLDGGAAQIITDEFHSTGSPTVSPDGTTLAVAYSNPLRKTDAPPSGLALINLENQQVLRTFGVPNFRLGSYYEQPTLQWTPDGGAVNFIVLRDGVSNIWRQPIAGGERAQITNFKDRRVFNFAFSPDGKQIALARGKISSDVVLIENAE